MIKYLPLLYLFLIVQSCATYETQYAADESMEAISSDAEVLHSFYLIGDAGIRYTQDVVLKDVLEASKDAGENSTLLFLGDNIYWKGMPAEDHPEREEKEIILDAQIALGKQFPGNTIFIAGNHDWYSGLKGLERQRERVQETLGKKSFYPDDGCGFKRIKMGDELVLIVIDSQWYITNWDNHPTMNDDCDIKTKAQFWEEVESEIKKADGKTTLIAIHNPVLTNGSHGGQYSFKSHMKPLPVLGSFKNLFRKTGGVSNTDNQNNIYRELSDRLKAYSQFGNKVIFVSGHDHNLQFIQKDNVTQIVSGSGAKKSATRLTNGGKFSSSDQGYARLDVMKDGSSQVHFYSSDLGKEIYAAKIFPENKDYKEPEFKEIQTQATAKIYEDDRLNKSKFYTFIWGKRHRKHYGTEVTVPSVDLSNYLGGLTPVRKGGGHQSKSLHMVNPEGKEYVMRALKKSATQFIQAVGFKDQYVQDSFNETATEDLILDVFTGAHPYAPFTVAGLSESIGVLYANPTLVYVPKQKTLGKYNEIFGDELYMIEEKVTDGHGDLESFANADEVINTYDLFKQIRKDEDNQVDQRAFLRARLFDMVIGDWDRHYDQWKWAVKNDGKKETYVAIPRDRDQAFSNMSDGLLMGYLTRSIPNLSLMQKYTAEPRNIKRFNLEPYPLDVALLPDMTMQDWKEEIAFIQANLTDEVIEQSMSVMPKEVQDESFTHIVETLKKRRDNLSNYGMEYFEVVNKTATITGTDKDDFFEVQRLADGSTEVSVYRIKGGEKKDRFHHKVFSPEFTKEIWLYGLDDKDVFHVYGDGKAKIKVRIIGGQNHDVYRIENPRKLKVYDYKSKKSTFENKNVNKRLTDHYKTNVYDYHNIKYNNLVWAFPALGYNPDNGIMIGPSLTYTVNNFEQNPFSQKHQAQLKFFTATEGVEVSYLGEFARVLGDANLILEGLYQSPYYSKNFFGYGMNSVYNDEVALDYNRTLVEEFRFKPSLKLQKQNGQFYQLGLSYQSMELDKTANRFVSETDQIEEAAFSQQNFVGVFGRFNYENKDNPVFPSLAMLLNVEAGYKANLDRDGHGYTYIHPSLGFSHKLVPSGDLVLATLFKAQINSTEDIEYYQAASIGGDNGLRGFRNQRFTGKTSFTQSSDLRWKVGSLKTPILPISFGIYGGFDYGRVWSDYDISDIWKTSYGGGVFLHGAEKVGLKASYFRSEDGGRFVIGAGFGF
ncbi:metallophosphoesterase [Weeksellaceae bacterium KMM 9713]|uniref:Metallophosphoesterase n=1 Tax=Profundicola chukchiensis TaxID=2961959 RepID=A0A9X4RU23_9FLAO|nr:metallophosphoesterase [Profundicola chukchiensis]MDG4945703.1 metallophosphoesterase [Profundicola chukchiensis]